MTTVTPAAAQLAMLATCLASDPEVEPQLRTWEALVDLDDLDGPSFALVPFLHLRLRHVGVQARDAGRLKGIYARAWYLEATGVERPTIPAGAVALRGAAVRLVAYDGQPARSATDTVVLGPSAGSGPTSTAGVGRAGVLWQLGDASADPGVLDRAVAGAHDVVGSDGSVLRTCAPAYHFLDALLRGTGWLPDSSLVPLLDAGLLAQRCGPADWDLVVDEVDRCGWRPLVEPRLRVLSDGGGHVPPDVADRISRLRAGTGAGLVAMGARRAGWQRRVLRGAFGLYLSDPDRARGARAIVDYPVRNSRLAAQALRRRRAGA